MGLKLTVTRRIKPTIIPELGMQGIKMEASAIISEEETQLGEKGEVSQAHLESGCIAHAMTCGAGIGVFLLIRRTTILLQRCARQAPWSSPYLDAFGEEDIEMHRGKPLYLNEERYAALTYMVASHGLDRSSKVLGQTTIGTLFMV